MSQLIQFHHVSINYKNKTAIDDITLAIPPGKIIGLLGPNGSGKTTFIKLLNGLLQPSCGEIVIDGYHPSVKTKKIISYLPDTSYLQENLKIRDTLAFFKDFYEDFNLEKANRLLKDLKLDCNQTLSSLSKGDKEKIQLLLVMSRQAKLYILDEPIGGVDPAARDYILRTIINNYSEDASVLLATHLISDVEPILDEVILLNNGQMILQGNCDDLREKHSKSIDRLFRDIYKITREA